MTNNAGVAVDPRALRAARFKLRMTQSDVAREIGCSTSHYRNVEAGRVRLSLPLLGALEALHHTTFEGVSWP